MTTLFFYGTLRHAPLLSLVLGHEPDVTPARLPGYRVVWAEGEAFPMIIEAPGERADGVIARELSDEDVARIDFYEGAFSYRLVDVVPEGPEGPVPARVYIPVDAPWRPGQPWDLKDWAVRWGDLTLLAAAEVMRAFGRESAEAVGRRFNMIRSRAAAKLAAGCRSRPVTVSSPYTRDDVEVADHRLPYEKFFAVEEFAIRFRRFDGSWSEEGERAIFQVADAVTVLPYDPVRDTVLLVEQVRIGVYAHGDRQPWLLEPVAGIVDAGESYEQTARREALEEAHVTLDALHHVASYYPTPGGVAQYLASFVGIADLGQARREIGGLETEGENIRNLVVGYDQLVAMLHSGELANAPLILTVQWLMLNRDRLRADAGAGLR